MSNSYAAVHLAGLLAEVRVSQRVVVTRYASPTAFRADAAGLRGSSNVLPRVSFRLTCT
jgi:hypothetical protein